MYTIRDAILTSDISQLNLPHGTDSLDSLDSIKANRDQIGLGSKPPQNPSPAPETTLGV